MFVNKCKRSDDFYAPGVVIGKPPWSIKKIRNNNEFYQQPHKLVTQKAHLPDKGHDRLVDRFPEKLKYG